MLLRRDCGLRKIGGSRRQFQNDGLADWLTGIAVAELENANRVLQQSLFLRLQRQPSMRDDGGTLSAGDERYSFRIGGFTDRQEGRSEIHARDHQRKENWPVSDKRRDDVAASNSKIGQSSPQRCALLTKSLEGDARLVGNRANRDG